jgi:TM2 domain-containing membrane protein YozV
LYSTFLAYLLWFFSGFGVLGFHRFYLGKIGTGLLYMVTGGLFGIGAFYDLLTMPLQVREANLRLDYRNAMVDALGRGAVTPQDRTATGSARVLNKNKESLEQVILRTARRRSGIVTPSEVALESDRSLDEAKKALETLVNKGYADLRVSKNGALVYFFQEFSDNGSHPDLEEM